eukprot:TRINITY_DN43391_c0_g1_i1.p1 TRINITY_DN43391_c0_g1~~TRINITY_DN43391_c0_g1_i1.p1  ORF type:complete len:314 (+),score=79.15 TRINITY_DN43391_c0_g1_i1:53-994(+)
MAVHVTFALIFANLLQVEAYRSTVEVQKESHMVCCLQGIVDADNVKLRLMNPEQAATTGKFHIKQECKLVAMAPADCERDPDECEEKCVQKMKAHPSYLEMMKGQAKAEWQHVKQTVAPKEREEARQNMTRTVALAREALSDAEKIASEKNLTFEQKKAALEDATEQLALAQKEKTETDRQLVNQTSITEKQTADAEQQYNQKVSDIDAKLTAAEEKIRSLEDSGMKAREASPMNSVPHQCDGEKYCCCSIRHVGVRVKTQQFTDWSECKNPQPYTKSKNIFAGKSGKCDTVMVHCARCAKKVCADRGYGVCP